AVADEIERQLGVERGADEIVRPDEADGVAVRRSREVGLGADVAAGANPVLDDELVAEFFRQILSEQPRRDVIWPAGREANDESDRLVRIIERRGAACQQSKRTHHEREQTSKTGHGFPHVGAQTKNSRSDPARNRYSFRLKSYPCKMCSGVFVAA